METDQLMALRANAPVVQDFLSRVIQSGDKAVLSAALDAYCTIAPSDESVKMSLNVVQAWLDFASKGELTDKDIPYTDVLEQLVKSGIATPTTQDQIIPALPALLEVFSADELNTFNEFLYRVVSSADLTDKAQTALSEYLEAQEPQPAASSTYFHWADASTRVSGGQDPIIRLGMIADVIRDSDEPLNIASVIVYGPVETLGCFTPTELANFKTQLSGYSTSKDEETGLICRTAIETIDDYQAGRAAPTPQLKGSK
jgi:hypothetical protein